VSYRLVSAGYARPRQTTLQLLNSFDVGMLVDFAYGMIVEKMQPEQREAFDKSIDAMNDESQYTFVTVETSSGRKIRVTEARLREIRENAGRTGALNLNRARKRKEAEDGAVSS
jgi:hypothetical protein